MKEYIKYFCYYDTVDADIKRNYVLSATNKLNYIWRVMNRIGYGVEVISASSCVELKMQYAPSELKSIGNYNSLRLFPSFGGPRFIRVIGRYLLWINFFFWFCFNVKRGEKIIVYHSLGYCKLFILLQKLTGCRIIGEIEEIYQDVSPQNKSLSKSEYKFIERCDSYIFPTELMDYKLNISGKPSVIVHGIYEVEKNRNVHWDDSDIHVVYAGTFDPNKGGAAAAVAAVKFLPRGYHIHICGFGTDSQIANIRKIVECANKGTDAKVTFDGMLKGEEFIQFLQKCHIGLSTQNPDAAFNATSFPSKILTYLANGLSVVSIRIPAIEQSGVGDYISYYDEQSPEEIAKAIKTCGKNNSNKSPYEILSLLDDQLKNDIQRLLMV